jgi:hypothetical protein
VWPPPRTSLIRPTCLNIASSPRPTGSNLNFDLAMLSLISPSYKNRSFSELTVNINNNHHTVTNAFPFVSGVMSFLCSCIKRLFIQRLKIYKSYPEPVSLLLREFIMRYFKHGILFRHNHIQFRDQIIDFIASQAVH